MCVKAYDQWILWMCRSYPKGTGKCVSPADDRALWDEELDALLSSIPPNARLLCESMLDAVRKEPCWWGWVGWWGGLECVNMTQGAKLL